MTADSKGDLSNVNATLKSFLSYINNGTLSGNNFITLLNGEVEKAKENL